MAKYDVKFSCGHTHIIELYGSTTDRERKIKYLEEYGVCPKCKEVEKANNCEEVEMFYGEYKKNYNDCKTKVNSYDKKRKTIIVYVPKKDESTEGGTTTITENEAIKEMCKVFNVMANDAFIEKCKKQLSKPFNESLKSFEKGSENASTEKIEKGRKILNIIKNYKKSIGEI